MVEPLLDRRARTLSFDREAKSLAITSPSRDSFRSLLVVSALILAILTVGALHLARAILIPLALAILLTFVFVPVVTRIERMRLGRIASVLLVGILVFALLAGVGAAITLQARSLAGDLLTYQENIINKIRGFQDVGEGTRFEKVRDAVNAITESLSSLNKAAPIKPTDDSAAPAPAAPTPPVAEPAAVKLQTSVFEQLGGVASSALELLATAGLVTILVVFMLIKREDLRNRIIRLVGHGRLTGTTKALDDAAQRVSRFLFMQFSINLCFGTALSLGLYLVGVPYAFLWGALAGGLRFVPYVGTSIAGFLILTFSVAAFDGWSQPLMVLALFLVLEVVAAHVVEPLLFGHSTGISPIALLIAAAFWTWLWGPIGLLLSTPLTVCLVVLGKNVSHVEFFDVLLGDEPALETNVRYYQRLLAKDQDEAIDLVEQHLGAHPREEIYDQVLLPALVQAKRDRERGALTPEDEQFVFQGMREVLDEVVAPPKETSAAAAETPGAVQADESTVLVFGCPSGDEADELALHMLRQLLAPGFRMEVISTKTLSAEVIARVEREHPALVCIAALPPSGLAQARYLCKRLRTQLPELKILVGRWGQIENTEKIEDRLRAAGANHVSTSLLETRKLVLPLLKLAASQ